MSEMIQAYPPTDSGYNLGNQKKCGSGGSGCVHLLRLRQRWSGISARCSQETNLSMRRLRR